MSERENLGTQQEVFEWLSSGFAFTFNDVLCSAQSVVVVNL